MYTLQTLITDRGYRATGISAQLLCALNISFHDAFVKVGHKLFRIDFRQTEIDDAFNAEGKTNDQGQSYQ